MRPLVHHPDQQEERARGEAVVHHLQDAAGHRLRGEGEDPQHHEAQVGDRRVGHQPLDVGLDQGAHRSVDDPDHRQDRHERGEVLRRLREQPQVVADQPVGPHLQQDTGQQDRPGGGRLGVGIGEPGVEREDRHLDREGHEEREEEPPGRGDGEGLGDHRELIEVERPVPQMLSRLHVQEDRTHQQEGGPGHRVEEELHGGVDAPVAPPAADEQVHRHQHRLEEEEEQQQVERHERAEHRRLQGQHGPHVEADVLLHPPRGEDRHGEQEGGEEHHPDTDPVDAHDVVDAQALQQGHTFHQLDGPVARIEAAQHEQRGDEGHQCGAHRDGTSRLVFETAATDQEHQHADERQQEHDGE